MYYLFSFLHWNWYVHNAFVKLCKFSLYDLQVPYKILLCMVLRQNLIKNHNMCTTSYLDEYGVVFNIFYGSFKF